MGSLWYCRILMLCITQRMSAHRAACPAPACAGIKSLHGTGRTITIRGRSAASLILLLSSQLDVQAAWQEVQPGSRHSSQGMPAGPVTSAALRPLSGSQASRKHQALCVFEKRVYTLPSRNTSCCGSLLQPSARLQSSSASSAHLEIAVGSLVGVGAPVAILGHGVGSA